MEKLTQSEIEQLNFAVKHGFLDESQAEEMMESPELARKFLEESEVEA